MSLSVRSLSTLDQKNNNEYITPRGPWNDLDPNDFTQWWKKHYIVNPTKFIKKKIKITFMHILLYKILLYQEFVGTCHIGIIMILIDMLIPFMIGYLIKN